MAIIAWFADKTLVNTTSWGADIAASGSVSPPNVTTASMPTATVGAAYSQTLTATGTAPITWTVAGALPAGLSRSGATISGTPTTAGTWQITATATNDYGSSSRVLTIGISAAAVAEKRSSPWARWFRK